MDEGKIFHAYILEKDAFNERYIIQDVPGPSSGNQEGFAQAIAKGATPEEAYLMNYSASKITEKAEEKVLAMYQDLSPYIDFLKKVDGREIVSQSFGEKIKVMKEQLFQNEAARFYLDMVAETEKPVTWKWKGFNWRGYIDALGSGVIIDLKRVADADPDKIMRQIRYGDLGYQAVHYRNVPGYEKYRFVFIAIDNVGHVSVVEMSDNTIGAIRETLEYKMNRFKTCLIQNEWQKSYDFWIDGGVYYA